MDKSKRHSNPYDSVYKFIRFLYFRQSEDESCDKFLKRFLGLISSVKLSGIDVTTQSNLKDMEYKKLIKSEPNNSIAFTKNVFFQFIL